MNTQYKKSLTLKELIEKLQVYHKEHPTDENKMIYFDGLHINGYISSLGLDILELL